MCWSSTLQVIREVIKVHSGELAREWKEESCEEEKEKAEKKEKEQVKEKEEEERGSISSSKRYCTRLTRTEYNKWSISQHETLNVSDMTLMSPVR